MNAVVDHCDYETPIGRFRAEARGGAVVALSPVVSSQPLAPPRVDVLRALGDELSAYFSGALDAFTVPVDPAGTSFQRSVWAALRAIPRGETISYAELARRVGRPKAARAVGAANGKNPIPIVIPCHRVIGANGELVGFAWGLGCKSWLLEHEAAGAARSALTSIR
jgi:methylated-DNA-[protein]-cysteine S-methyltransferase